MAELDDDLRLRIDSQVLAKFKRKTKRAGRPYQCLIREMIDAFNNGHLHITLTAEQLEQHNSLGDLYVTGK